VTKLPHKSGVPIGELGQWTSDQVCRGSASYESRVKNDRSSKRSKHFLGILREKLKDPEFREIEGFPIGSNEDILALSDPPYYTACPNPWVANFIRHYGKPYDPETDVRRPNRPG
jgi:hypothetical protein